MNEQQVMNEQQRLLAAIWDDSAVEQGFTQEGIAIYRRNLLANARRGLSLSFPTLFELLDSNDSDELVAEFLKSSPPNQGDWGQWGGDLAAFLKTHRLSEEYPYLADCAALDWQVHCGLQGPDWSVDSQSLARLGDTEPEKLHVVLNPNVALLTSDYPIFDIYQAHHLESETEREAAFTKARQLLQAGPETTTTMIYRPEFQPKISQLSDSEALFMQALLADQSLGEALDLVTVCDDFSFEQWLTGAIKNNLINRLVIHC